MKVSSKIFEFFKIAAFFSFIELVCFLSDFNTKEIINRQFIFKNGTIIQNIIFLIFFWLLYFFIITYLSYRFQKSILYNLNLKQRFILITKYGIILRLIFDLINILYNKLMPTSIAYLFYLINDILFLQFLLFIAFYLPMRIAKNINLEEYIALTKKDKVKILILIILIFITMIISLIVKEVNYNNIFNNVFMFLNYEPAVKFDFLNKENYSITYTIISIISLYIFIFLNNKFFKTNENNSKRQMIATLFLIIGFSGIIILPYAVLKVAFPTMFPYNYTSDYSTGWIAIKDNGGINFNNNSYEISKSKRNSSEIQYNKANVEITKDNKVLLKFIKYDYPDNSYEIEEIKNQNILCYTIYSDAILINDLNKFKVIKGEDFCKLKKDNNIASIFKELVNNQNLKWTIYCSEYLLKYNPESIKDKLIRYSKSKYTDNEIKNNSNMIREKLSKYSTHLLSIYNK